MPELMKEQEKRHSSVELQELLTFRLSRLQARANAHAAKILDKHAGISLSEWRVFVMVETYGKISPAQIVRLTNFDKGLVSRTVKKLQEKGLLTVEVNKSDQRSHEIDFTDEGLTLFQQARPAMRKRQQVLRQSLEPDEVAQLFKAFDKLDAALIDMERTL